MFRSQISANEFFLKGLAGPAGADGNSGDGGEQVSQAQFSYFFLLL